MRRFVFLLAVILAVGVGFASDVQAEPRIELERVVHDFGEIGAGTQHVCEFKFRNVGDSVLKITEVTRTCGCTPFELEKTEYEPGESGVLKVRYDAGHRDADDRKNIFMMTNDPANERVSLTIQAQVVHKVSHEPSTLKLVLSEDNAGAGTIKLKSVDDQKFRIRSFTSTGNCITAEIDRSKEAKSFELEPQVDIERLGRTLDGVIRINLTHPEARSLTIPFETLARYEVNPPSINILNVKPGEPVERDIWVLSNYGGEFSVEEVSSENGTVELLGKEQVGSRFKLEIRITPPEDMPGVLFSDTLKIELSDDEQLEVRVRGFFSRS